MRHAKHRFQLGVKKEHRLALMANLAVALITHGRIRTTLAKAKALRPFVEKIITLAKKAAATQDKAKKLHYRRQAIAKIRDAKAVAMLFDEKVQEFTNRNGGYTRIYKLVPRQGDAASMGLIEFVNADDEGYSKRKKKPASAKKAATPRAKETAPAVSSADSENVEATADDASEDSATEETKE